MKQGVASNALHNDGRVKQELEIGPTELQKSSMVVPDILMKIVREDSIPGTSVGKMKFECADGLHNETISPDYDFNKECQLVATDCVKREPEDQDTDQGVEGVKPVCKGEQFMYEQQIQKANVKIEFEFPGVAPNEIKLEKNSMESDYPFHMEYLVEVTPTVEHSDSECEIEDIKPIFIEEASTSKPEETAMSSDGDPLGTVQHATASTVIEDVGHEARLPKEIFKRSPFSQQYDSDVPLNCLMSRVDIVNCHYSDFPIDICPSPPYVVASWLHALDAELFQNWAIQPHDPVHTYRLGERPPTNGVRPKPSAVRKTSARRLDPSTPTVPPAPLLHHNILHLRWLLFS
ncbi:hypothetical protein EVAR_86171_1 [Eumeta japonica]|uniref:Uncharacterized protein n=1 Tax=Eumeta variegata TaxID=151549 RepID=A0A4C2A5M4_EUMVA|nr:hypothetical protein EVAR_86171_1 [Eumeta japonica]